MWGDRIGDPVGAVMGKKKKNQSQMNFEAFRLLSLPAPAGGGVVHFRFAFHSTAVLCQLREI
eukprot:scaffold17189_cov67-Cyclotella_meneghiniana.AAC.3